MSYLCCCPLGDPKIEQHVSAQPLLPGRGPHTQCINTVLLIIQGGDLRQAMTQAPAELHWYNKGCSVALDIIKGLHFLHRHMVR